MSLLMRRRALFGGFSPSVFFAPCYITGTPPAGIPLVPRFKGWTPTQIYDTAYMEIDSNNDISLTSNYYATSLSNRPSARTFVRTELIKIPDNAVYVEVDISAPQSFENTYNTTYFVITDKESLSGATDANVEPLSDYVRSNAARTARINVSAYQGQEMYIYVGAISGSTSNARSSQTLRPFKNIRFVIE